MNKIIYTLFLSIFLSEYLSKILGLGRYITWIPELLSILAILIVSGLFMLKGVKDVPPKVPIFLTLFLLNIAIGIFVNLVPAGPVIAGLRTYLKFIPFFLLPLVYHFSQQQIKQQLKLLLFLFMIQTPVALYQRLVISKGFKTGDYVRGTLLTSGQVTVILTCAITILICFYLSKKITLKSFVVIFFMLFIPTSINETKSTVILLPIAIMLPLYFSSRDIKLKLTQFIPVLAFGSLVGIAFILIYDYFMYARWGYGVMEFFSEGRAQNYLYKGTNPNEVVGHIGKIDSFVVALKTTLSKSPLNLFFGLGIGNVSISFTPELSGVYAEKYSLYNIKSTALSLLLWETGIFGAMLYYSLFFMVFKDARYLSKCKDDFISILSRGFSAVIVILAISSAYVNYLEENTTAYLIWYFSGFIISESFRYKRENNIL